MMWTIKN